MFHMADNEEIGQYLKEKIYAKFESNREFCRKWLEVEHMDVNDLELRRKSNKLTQIQKGRKSVQIEDLPVLSGLLDLTCEQILSAGKVWVEDTGRLTNYHVAFTHDPELWEAYVQREDRIFLSADEYNKTVIDYALEFKNYEFLKYLMEQGHIKFIDNQDQYNSRSFGASTDIARRAAAEDQNLKQRIESSDAFRRRLILLAIENNDPFMLRELKTREIPSLYSAHHQFCWGPSCKEFYDPELIRALSTTDRKTLEYLYEPFDILTSSGQTYTFRFPFIGELTDHLIETGNHFTEKALEICYAHNRAVRDQILKYTELNIEKCVKAWKVTEDRRTVIEERRFDYLSVNAEKNMVSFSGWFAQDGFVSNIIQIRVKADEAPLNAIIRKINVLYDWVVEKAVDRG